MTESTESLGAQTDTPNPAPSDELRAKPQDDQASKEMGSLGTFFVEYIAEQRRLERGATIEQACDDIRSLSWMDIHHRQNCISAICAHTSADISLHAAAVERAVREEREACATVLDDGSFLSEDSTARLWAKQVAALIRAREVKP